MASVPLETITNLLNTVLPSTSNNASKNATGAKPQGRRPYPRDANDNIIPLNKENQPKSDKKKLKKKSK